MQYFEPLLWPQPDLKAHHGLNKLEFYHRRKLLYKSWCSSLAVLEMVFKYDHPMQFSIFLNYFPLEGTWPFI